MEVVSINKIYQDLTRVNSNRRDIDECGHKKGEER